MCGMTNTTGSGESGKNGPPPNTAVKRCTCDAKDAEIGSLRCMVTEVRNERDCWLETARQESNGREYYRSLVVKIGEMFGVSAKTCDDGTVVEDVLCAKVPELVSAALRREVVLREALKEALPWLMRDAHREIVQRAQAALSACDEGGK